MAEDIVRSFGYLTLGSRLRRIGERLQADAQMITAANGGSVLVSQYPFLAALDRDGPLTIGELAAATGVTQPGATRTLAQLVKDGLVEAHTTPDDLRRRNISLTEQGQAAVDSGKRNIWPRIEAAVQNLCADLEGPLLTQLAALEDGLATRSLPQRVAAQGEETR